MGGVGFQKTKKPSVRKNHSKGKKTGKGTFPLDTPGRLADFFVSIYIVKGKKKQETEVGDGFLWFFMQKSNAENPEDLIVEGTELGEQWLGTRGLVAPAQEPAEVDPAKWGPGGIYPMSWLLLVLCLSLFLKLKSLFFFHIQNFLILFVVSALGPLGPLGLLGPLGPRAGRITYQTLLGEAMALMSEGAPLYNGTSLSFDVDCATGVGPGAQGLRQDAPNRLKLAKATNYGIITTVSPWSCV